MNSFVNFIKNRWQKSTLFDAILLSYSAFMLVMTIYFISTNAVWNNIAIGFFFLTIPLFILIIEQLTNITFPTFFILILLIIPIGATLGLGFNFYVKFPWWDDVLHTISGFIFAFLGYYLACLVFKNANGKNNAFGKILFGFIFSLSIALLWEMFEYFLAGVFGIDMQDDQIITSIDSYLVSGKYNNATHIDNITKTIIYYGNGEQLEINGYLDIGMWDTLRDMFVCTLGSFAYIIVMIISSLNKKKRVKSVISDNTIEDKTANNT